MATLTSPPQPRDQTLQIRRIDPDVRHEMTVECARQEIFMPELIERMWDAYVDARSKGNHKPRD